MNTGQMMLSILALILLGTTVLTVNSSNLSEGTIMRQSAAGIYAVSLATSFVQKALSLDFDEGTVTRPPSVATNLDPSTATFTTTANFAATTKFLTTPVNLGIETNASGRNIYPLPSNNRQEYLQRDSSFDDFDDYNGFLIDTTIANVDRFRVTAVVYYVTTPTTAQPTPTRSLTATWLKRVDFSLNGTISRKVFQNPNETIDQGTDTIKISYIKSFY